MCFFFETRCTMPFTLVHTGKYRTDWRHITNTNNTQAKHNSEKANNTKPSKTKLPRFSYLLWHSVRKQGGLILQRSLANMGRGSSIELWHRCSTSMIEHLLLLDPDYGTVFHRTWNRQTCRAINYVAVAKDIFVWIVAGASAQCEQFCLHSLEIIWITYIDCDHTWHGGLA